MNFKELERFEKCKGLRKRMIPGKGIDDPFPDDRFSVAYYLVGFKNVFVIYDFKEDKVRWYQRIDSRVHKKKGVRVWEAMTSGQQKAFLFDIDWFLGD